MQEESSNADEIVYEVLKWLSQPSNNQWLLIFDIVGREFPSTPKDADAFDVKKYFLRADHRSVLSTSRPASVWRLGTDMKLEPVDELQGESILIKSIGKSVDSELISNARFFRHYLISKVY